MSVNKFKVGDKVRVREGLVVGKYYGDMCCYPFMDKIGGEILTVDSVQNIYYGVKENACYWSNEMLELAERPLDNLCTGDLIKSGDEIKMVLAALDSCYLLSNLRTYDIADKWYTAEQLKIGGFKLFDPQVKVIEINGKKYDEADIERAIKDLEPIE